MVYVLANDGLREGWFKIGCSRRSGAARAYDLNAEASTGTPGSFRCLFERLTLDCGLAEQRVFAHLSKQRRGKWGQEFFEVSLEYAKTSIEQVCCEVDIEEQKRRERVIAEAQRARSETQAKPSSNGEQPSAAFVAKPMPPVAPPAKRVPSIIWWGLVVAVVIAYNHNWSNGSRTAVLTPQPTALAKSPAKAPAPSTPAPKWTNEIPVPLDENGVPAFGRPPPAENEGPSELVDDEVPNYLRGAKPARPPEATASLQLKDLSSREQSVIRTSCFAARSAGPATHDACIAQQLAALENGPRRPSTATLASDEVSSLEMACFGAHSQGVVAYNECVVRQLRDYEAGPQRPDLSRLSQAELSSLRMACFSARSQGPRKQNECFEGQLANLSKAPSRPDLSGLSREEKSSLSAACFHAHMQGPAADNTCVVDQLEQLRQYRAGATGTSQR